MRPIALRLAALATTLFVFAGSVDYAASHVKNVSAPLQPPVADRPSATPGPVQPTPTPLPPLVTQRGRTPAPTGTPAPRLTIAPGVRLATLAPLTFTHTS
jgi:hypothetical protein